VSGPGVIVEAEPGRSPTPEQEKAAAIAGRDVLLEAGAGTGKTGVMVDRYCRLVCDRGVDPEAILAFTFTDKAAAELRQRIRAELERRAAAGSDRAGELLRQIGSAWITTIHGFCNRVLAAHPVSAGIDPSFRVLDAPEAERVARGAFESALDAFLAETGEGGEDLLATFDLDGLRAIVTSLHAELRSRGDADPQLPPPPAVDLAAALAAAAEASAAALVELKPDDPKRPLLELAGETLGSASVPSLDELCSLRLESRAKSIAAYCEAIEAAIARSAEAGEGGVAYRQIGRLLELFSVRFAAAKERRAGLDFEDLQIFAATLLEGGEVGRSYRARFSHLMVDEFQDTNRLQLRLIEALRGPESELIAVGDELQSIYGFRHADLEVFRQQRRLIAASPRGETLELSGNFRSRPELIGAVNALGGVLFGDAFHRLRVGAPPSRPLAGEGPAVELLLTCRDGWDEEGIDLAPAVDGRTPANCLAEARFVAERLRALADEGVERSEMVVLLRAFTHLDAYEDSLERAGLRPYVLGGRGYWSQQQVTDVCALLATIANPLDDQSLFGALASPAAGVAPDTLWLLRAAAGRKRHVWPAVEAAVADVDVDLAEPERLGQIPAAELSLLRRFSETLANLRERAWRMPLAELIERAVTDTGYDLAVLMRPAGKARFANVRKLMRLAEGFELREGRDLRGFLDFLASRAEIDSEAQAATAVEGHDGVRIMTIHCAKGLEFGVVAVPDLSRSLLAGSRAPLLTVGREAEPRVGMQLRRLGAGSINLFAHRELCDEAKERDAAEGLRLFHVAATRARERLILSGVVRPRPGNGGNAGTPLIERIVDGLGIDRETGSTLAVAPPEPRLGLDAAFEASEICVRVHRPSAARAAELSQIRAEEAMDPRSIEAGPAPLLARRTPGPARRPLSYTAITALGNERAHHFPRHGEENSESAELDNEDATARGIAVHSLLEWSAGNGWRQPSSELARRYAAAAGLPDEPADDLLAPVRAWLGSELFAQRLSLPGAGARSEVPLLLELEGTVLRGSIDLLVEREGTPPLVVDYKTDRLGEESPGEHVARYGVQRDIYAIAVSEARHAPEVEVAYVFLERPEEPVVATLGAAEMAAGRERLSSAIARIHGS
jgi:ATP-dependent exoDNAse (exonuclease V) beta subunit